MVVVGESAIRKLCARRINHSVQAIIDFVQAVNHFVEVINLFSELGRSRLLVYRFIDESHRVQEELAGLVVVCINGFFIYFFGGGA